MRLFNIKFFLFYLLFSLLFCLTDAVATESNNNFLLPPSHNTINSIICNINQIDFGALRLFRNDSNQTYKFNLVNDYKTTDCHLSKVSTNNSFFDNNNHHLFFHDNYYSSVFIQYLNIKGVHQGTTYL